MTEPLATSHHTEQWWHHVHHQWLVHESLLQPQHVWNCTSCTWVTESAPVRESHVKLSDNGQKHQNYYKWVEDVYHSCNLTRHFDHLLMDSHCGLLYNIYTVLTYNRASTNTCKIQRQEGQRHHQYAPLGSPSSMLTCTCSRTKEKTIETVQIY